MGAGYVFFVYAAMCVVSFLLVAAVMPETRGETLEEIERGWVRPGPQETRGG